MASSEEVTCSDQSIACTGYVIRKISELRELSKRGVRIIVIGPPRSGKSTLIKLAGLSAQAIDDVVSSREKQPRDLTRLFRSFLSRLSTGINALSISDAHRALKEAGIEDKAGVIVEHVFNRLGYVPEPIIRHLVETYRKHGKDAETTYYWMGDEEALEFVKEIERKVGVSSSSAPEDLLKLTRFNWLGIKYHVPSLLILGISNTSELIRQLEAYGRLASRLGLRRSIVEGIGAGALGGLISSGAWVVSSREFEELAEKLAALASRISGVMNIIIPSVGSLVGGVASAIVSTIIANSESRSYIDELIQVADDWGKLNEDLRRILSFEISQAMGLNSMDVYSFFNMLSNRQALDNILGRLSAIKDEVNREIKELRDTVNRLESTLKEHESRLKGIEELIRVSRLEGEVYSKPEDMGVNLDSMIIDVHGELRHLVLTDRFIEYSGRVMDGLREGKVVLISGSKGIGKSTLVKYTLSKALEKNLIDSVIQLNYVPIKPSIDAVSKGIGPRMVILFDPSEMGFYTIQSPKPEESVVTVDDLTRFIKFTAILRRVSGRRGFKVPIVLILSNDLKDIAKDELSELGSELSEVAIDLRDPDLLKGIILNYSGCSLSEGELVNLVNGFNKGNEHVKGIIDYDSYTLMAVYVGKALRENGCSVNDVEELLSKGAGDAASFMRYYIYEGLLNQQDLNTKRRFTYPLIIHAHLGEMPIRWAMEIPAYIEGDSTELDASLAEWASIRHEDVVEEAIRGLMSLNLSGLSKSSREAIEEALACLKCREQGEGIRSLDETLKLTAGYLAGRLVKAMSSNCLTETTRLLTLIRLGIHQDSSEFNCNLLRRLMFLGSRIPEAVNKVIEYDGFINMLRNLLRNYNLCNLIKANLSDVKGTGEVTDKMLLNLLGLTWAATVSGEAKECAAEAFTILHEVVHRLPAYARSIYLEFKPLLSVIKDNEAALRAASNYLWRLAESHVIDFEDYLMSNVGLMIKDPVAAINTVEILAMLARDKDTGEAIKMLDRGIRLIEELCSTRPSACSLAKAEAYQSISESYEIHGYYDEAWGLLNRAESAFSELTMNDDVRQYLESWYVGPPEASLSYFIKEGLAFINYERGRVMFTKAKFNEAESYLNKAESAYRELGLEKEYEFASMALSTRSRFLRYGDLGELIKGSGELWVKAKNNIDKLTPELTSALASQYLTALAIGGGLTEELFRELMSSIQDLEIMALTAPILSLSLDRMINFEDEYRSMMIKHASSYLKPALELTYGMVNEHEATRECGELSEHKDECLELVSHLRDGGSRLLLGSLRRIIKPELVSEVEQLMSLSGVNTAIELIAANKPSLSHLVTLNHLVKGVLNNDVKHLMITQTALHYFSELHSGSYISVLMRGLNELINHYINGNSRLNDINLTLLKLHLYLLPV